MGAKIDGVYLIATMPGRHSGDQVHKVKKTPAPSFYFLFYCVFESYSQHNGPGASDPSQQGVSRQNVDVKISAYDLAHTFFPAWEQTVGSCATCGHALGVMCSYSESV